MFIDRRDAGTKLAELLSKLDLRDPVIYAIPRGGVVVAAEVAQRLRAELTTVIVKKIGHPTEPEYAVGAIAEGTPETIVLGALSPQREELSREIERARAEVRERIGKYRQGKPLSPCMGRTAVVIDDGVATGLTARAALEEVRKLDPSELILAVPVIDRAVEKELSAYCDRIIAVESVNYLQAVGSYYLQFAQVSDIEVSRHLGTGGGTGS